MEFGVFVHAAVGPEYANTAVEHESIVNDLRVIRECDKYGFKYAWVSEHHALTEYSHLSAAESFMSYALAQTTRIHLGSGITPLNPPTNHPVRVAERVAMLDHLSNGRFEFGTGRGAGTHEVGTFGLHPSETASIYDEVIPEFRQMWKSAAYQHTGKNFTTPPRDILPKPYGGSGTHPPMWMAVASPSSFEKAGRLGLGAIGLAFSTKTVRGLEEYVTKYRLAIDHAEPVGEFVNNNFALANLAMVLEDGAEARRALQRQQISRISAYQLYYHDTFPRPDNVKPWPHIEPEMSLEKIEEMIQNEALCVGSPEEVINNLRIYESMGVDQMIIAFNFLPIEETLESIRIFGQQVIPVFDKDPVHRSSRMRYGIDADAQVARNIAEAVRDASAPI